MKIVIAGAGSVGYHLAKLLSHENQDITLIDDDEEILEQVASKLDVMTIRGNASSIFVLNEAEVKKADLFIAVTTSEETNLLSSMLAKQKGAKQTVARVSNAEFISPEQREYFCQVGIDSLISPSQLAANEICRLIKRASLTDIFDFEDEQISIVGFTIDNNSKLIGKHISKVTPDGSDIDYRGVALLRNHATIIPRGRTKLQRGDHLYLSIATKNIDRIMPLLGKQIKPIKNVMIVGDTPLALITAELLQAHYRVTVVMSGKSDSREFEQKLDKALVVIGDPGNNEILEQEGLKSMDAFIALTPNSEINILSSLVAEQSGVFKTIALVDNDVYTHISQNIGVDTIINKKLIAANNIFRFVRKGTVEAIATLHGVDAEIIEFSISKSNRITSNMLSELRLPESSIIAGVIRDKESIIPGGTFQLEVGDKVIVFVLPKAIKKVEEIFK
ncbi:MAG: trk system potassium uptake protein TrkA [Limisphaerales bacterium]|jgi:trk system potassium uptake protein TrkA